MTTTTIPALTSNNSVLNNFITQQQQAAAAAAAQTAAANGTSSTGTGTSAQSLAGNFNTFLKILTTQLTHQDPTSATDTNQFTQELVQFSQVEQQLNTNSDLTKLINLQTSNSLSSGLSYIGNYVEASSPTNQFALQNGNAEVGYTLASQAAKTSVAVVDANGQTIATLTGSNLAGPNYISWDGKDASGAQVPDGAYTFQVSAADANGNAITVSAQKAIAKVTAIQSNTDGSLQLICGGLSVSDSSIDAVFATGSLPNSMTAVPITSGT